MGAEDEKPLPECNDADARDIAEKWNVVPAAGGSVFSVDLLLEELARRVAELMARDRRTFFQTLYRLDVSEEKVNQSFRTALPKDQPRRLARLILEREIQKARSRQAHAAAQQAPEKPSSTSVKKLDDK